MAYDLDWFIATSWGKPWATIEAIQYDSAYLLVSNDGRVVDVKNNCPNLYEQVLSMAIAEFLSQAVLTDGGGIQAGAGSGATGSDHEAYVTSDKVYDVTRSYTLVKAAEETLKHKPLRTLDRIFEQCKSIVGVMRIAVGAGDDCGCGGPLGSRRVRIGDMTDGNW